MANWTRNNLVSFEETPISSEKYNAEVAAIYAALNAVDTTYVGTSAPVGKDAGTRWLDMNSTPSVWRVLDATVYRWFGVWTGIEANRPANPKTGCAIWVDAATNRAYVWNGSAYVGMKNADYDAAISTINSTLSSLSASVSGHITDEDIHLPATGKLAPSRFDTTGASAGQSFVANGLGGGSFQMVAPLANFTNLNDTPSSYSGQKGKSLVVNDAESALEFGSGSGGGSFVNLLHSAGNYATTDTSYAVVASGQFIADTSRHSATLKVLIERAVSAGTGQVRVAVYDGATTVDVETDTFTNTTRAQEFLEVDCSTLTTGLLWLVTIEAKNTTGTTTVSRIKVFALPANDAPSQTALCIAPAATFNATAYGSALDTQYFLAHQFHADGNSLIEFPVKVTLGSGVTEVMVKVVATGTFDGSTTSEYAEATFSADGIQTLRVPYPDIAASQLKVEVFGKVTGGSGFGTLDHYEARILM